MQKHSPSSFHNKYVLPCVSYNLKSNKMVQYDSVEKFKVYERSCANMDNLLIVDAVQTYLLPCLNHTGSIGQNVDVFVFMVLVNF